ncbi:electron transfer flavoprotein [Brenneria goodwinii]|uniref:Electron transfer flavoprotein n=1 Tax=Brenneria goodwinii TaxID=1109412 RepID=A0A0G4JWK9_9GAMM|nr:FAD-binding protein [Brenneria goodwinii]ATA22655.1 electron transfer flavoprotein [Brenneria goodwinii]RLM18329.1 electron transfer flavoprotein [Brenneria goodwinii]CPR17220.1 Electron transfer flavoprotein, alpha subunit [Brenneria goodwinii]
MNKLTNIWVFSDKNDRYAELLAGARQLGEQVTALAVNADGVEHIRRLGAADTLYWLGEMPALQRIENYAETIAATINHTLEQTNPRPATLILLAATKRGKALGARLSIQLDAALVNDVTALSIESGGICAEHRMYGGLAFGRERIDTPLVIATVSPGVFEPLPENTPHACPVTEKGYITPRQEIVCLERRGKPASSVDLSKAKRVVGIGRGLAAQNDLRMVQDLAARLQAEVGCSRPIAEGEHWMERERYIGVSGVLLKSDLYLALGISGQIQHMVGGNGAKTIVAVNKDKNAPIFQYADYGLVGDIYKVVPALIERLSR